MQLLAQTTTDSNDLFGGFKDFFDSDVWLVVRNVFFFFLVVFWLASAFWLLASARMAPVDASRSVWPSAGAVCTCRAPSRPDAPGRYSGTTLWPHSACR